MGSDTREKKQTKTSSPPRPNYKPKVFVRLGVDALKAWYDTLPEEAKKGGTFRFVPKDAAQTTSDEE